MKKLVIVFVLCCLVFTQGRANAASTDNFTISKFSTEMSLGLDSENRSTLQTTETITAVFPETDQNHGLEKVFVKAYNGHSVGLDVTSVTDESGASLPYHWSGDALRVGDSDTYVHGEKTYVIRYTQRDVTRYYTDTDKDEFYWDVVGLDWRVPIEKANIQISISPELARVLSGEPQCYAGVDGSNESCIISPTPTFKARGADEPALYSARVENVGSGNGVTVAFGFTKGTFAQYKASTLEQLFSIWGYLQIVAVPGSIALGVWLMTRWNKLVNRKNEMGTIVPEYLPPSDTSVTVAARLAGLTRSVMTAQLLDLAVRHYIKIYEVKPKTLFRPAQYEIEIIRDLGDLKWEEAELLRDTFGALPTTPGQRLNLKTLKNSTKYYASTQNNDSDLDKLVRGDYGLKEKDDNFKKWLRRISLVAFILAVVLLSPTFIFVSLLAFIMSFIPWRLTDKGLALKRYLEGLKMYIKVAEVERIKMLQSPEGAVKVSAIATGTDQAQLIKLYERVLPYAVLFGQEKQWNAQLGSYYESSGARPDWYAGQSTAFNAVAFSSAMSGFNSANSSVSSASSSTGGSSGGGSSGGGGGGGGGGGW